MDKIKDTFAQCKEENRAALVTYVTAGFPTAGETVDILLGLEEGGAGKSCALNTRGMQLITTHRHNRARTTLYRPNCRWSHNTKVEYTSAQEWSHG